MAQRVATAYAWCGLGYDTWRSQSGTRVQTTPAPVTLLGAPGGGEGAAAGGSRRPSFDGGDDGARPRSTSSSSTRARAPA